MTTNPRNTEGLAPQAALLEEQSPPPGTGIPSFGSSVMGNGHSGCVRRSSTPYI